MSSKKYREATNYLCDYLEEKIVDGRLDEPSGTFAQSVFGFSKQVEIKFVQVMDATSDDFRPTELPYFEVNPFIAPGLVRLSQYDAEFFDYCMEICSTNIYAQRPLPPALRTLASQVLSGAFERPRISSRPRKKNWYEESLLWSLTLEMVEDFNLKLTRSDEGSERTSACDAVAEALTICGRPTKYTEIKHLMVHPSKERRRAELKASKAIMGRWWNVVPPSNALTDEYWNFWAAAAQADMLDIFRTFSREQEKS